MQLESILTCPHCGHRSAETMPTDACRFFYGCKGCGMGLKPDKAIAAYSVRTARSRARRYKRLIAAPDSTGSRLHLERALSDEACTPFSLATSVDLAL
jgi:hypothetical protein